MSSQLELTHLARLEQRTYPALILLTRLLALSSVELEAEIARELEENPALERVDETGPEGSYEGPQDLCAFHSPDRSRPERAQEGATPFLLADASTAGDQLLADACLLLPNDDREIAEYVVGSLDERGYLPGGVHAVAAELQIDVDRVEPVVVAIREVGPAGICARDVRECLLLQLERLASDGCSDSVVAEIVDVHLEALAEGRLSEIATALDVSRADVLTARDFIRQRLRPYVTFEESPTFGATRYVRDAVVVPEVVVRQRFSEPAEFDVELTEPARTHICINGDYERFGSREDVARARAFLHRLEQRWRSLRVVSENVVARQKEFVRRGEEFLVPLTRAEVAQAVGLHESTVSRATAGKHVLLPSGRVVPFGVFFDASLPARTALELVIAREPQPLTDGELADEMSRRGVTIARRTVAKYRRELGILPSSLR
jgi:RNA polymerase sigma-54 factor